MQRRTKIVASIGPASDDEATLRAGAGALGFLGQPHVGADDEVEVGEDRGADVPHVLVFLREGAVVLFDGGTETGRHFIRP